MCHKDEENIGYLFKTYELAYNIWSTITINCHNPININKGIIEWIEHIWSLKNPYHKFFHYPWRKYLLFYGVCGIITKIQFLKAVKVIPLQFWSKQEICIITLCSIIKMLRWIF